MPIVRIGKLQGRCTAETPVPTAWDDWASTALPCATNDDCRGPEYLNFSKGRCVERQCCEESRHGNGTCACDAQFFGDADSTLSPACDFCPGYDWLTGVKSTICMGNGDCTKSLDMNGNYVDMRCLCGITYYIEDGIVNYNTTVQWYKDFCQCGDLNNDLQCDVCAPGFWGENCNSCPGGPGLHRTCGGHGTCDDNVDGTGECTCTFDMETTAWVLGEYQPRYRGDPVYRRPPIHRKCVTSAHPIFLATNANHAAP